MARIFRVLGVKGCDVKSARSGRDRVRRWSAEVNVAAVGSRRKGQPCATRKDDEWHRAFFSATRKRGKSDPLSPPKPRNRSLVNGQAEIALLGLPSGPSAERSLPLARPPAFSHVAAPAGCQLVMPRRAWFGVLGSIAPACSLGDNW
jgi:hypothetical protein